MARGRCWGFAVAGARTQDCKILFSGKEERVYMTKCCSFGFLIDLLVSRNAFMRRNPEEGDRGLRRNSGVEDVDAGCVEEVSSTEESTASESDMVRIG